MMAPTSSMAAPAKEQMVEGTIVAAELTEMVPTITVRRADGVMTKVRVDATTSVWQDGGAMPTRMTSQALRVDQRVTITGSQKEGLLQAASIKIAAPQSAMQAPTPPTASHAATTSSPAAPGRPTH